MPKQIIDEEGNEIEMFSKEELQAIETAKATELGSLQEELQKLKDKDLNFSVLREKAKTAEQQVESMKKEIDEKIQGVKREVLEGVMQDHYSETLTNLASGDAELQKKIEYHYKRLQDTAGTKQEVDKKLRDAWYLATKQDATSALHVGVVSSGGVSRPSIHQTNAFSQEEKALGVKFGIKEEDYEKYK